MTKIKKSHLKKIIKEQLEDMMVNRDRIKDLPSTDDSGFSDEPRQVYQDKQPQDASVVPPLPPFDCGSHPLDPNFGCHRFRPCNGPNQGSGAEILPYNFGSSNTTWYNNANSPNVGEVIEVDDGYGTIEYWEYLGDNQPFQLPGNGTNTLATPLGTTHNDCTGPWDWECQANSSCVPVLAGTTGPNIYPTAAACSAACQIAVSYDCDPNSGCVDPGTGLGQYVDINSCQLDCQQCADVSTERCNVDNPTPEEFSCITIGGAQPVQGDWFKSLGKIDREQPNDDYALSPLQEKPDPALLNPIWKYEVMSVTPKYGNVTDKNPTICYPTTWSCRCLHHHYCNFGVTSGTVEDPVIGNDGLPNYSHHKHHCSKRTDGGGSSPSLADCKSWCPCQTDGTNPPGGGIPKLGLVPGKGGQGTVLAGNHGPNSTEFPNPGPIKEFKGTPDPLFEKGTKIGLKEMREQKRNNRFRLLAGLINKK